MPFKKLYMRVLSRALIKKLHFFPMLQFLKNKMLDYPFKPYSGQILKKLIKGATYEIFKTKGSHQITCLLISEIGV